jgi:hypothetical protein
MKKLGKPATIASGLALLTTPSHAGGMAVPIMEADVITADAAAAAGAGSAAGWVLPLLFIAVLAAVASSSGSSGAPPGLE